MDRKEALGKLNFWAADFKKGIIPTEELSQVLLALAKSEEEYKRLMFFWGSCYEDEDEE